jgi:hypothetical protein
VTDRLLGVWVAFEKDIRVDDAEPLIAAIKQLKGVLEVKRDLIANPSDWMAQERAWCDLSEKIAAVLWPDVKRTR